VLVEAPQVQDEVIENSLAKRTRTDEHRIVSTDDKGAARLLKKLIMMGKHRKRLDSERNEIRDLVI
jgi:hypothetical protein